jgi:hypothetical protein
MNIHIPHTTIDGVSRKNDRSNQLLWPTKKHLKVARSVIFGFLKQNSLQETI